MKTMPLSIFLIPKSVSYTAGPIPDMIDKKEDTDIFQCLNELRGEMKQKGLIQEILDDILTNQIYNNY